MGRVFAGPIVDFTNTAITDTTATFTWTQAESGNVAKWDTGNWTALETGGNGTFKFNGVTFSISITGNITQNTIGDKSVTVEIGSEYSGNANFQISRLLFALNEYKTSIYDELNDFEFSGYENGIVIETIDDTSTHNSLEISVTGDVVIENDGKVSIEGVDELTNIKIQQKKGEGSWNDAEIFGSAIAISDVSATVVNLEIENSYSFRLVVTGGKNEGNSNEINVNTITKEEAAINLMNSTIELQGDIIVALGALVDIGVITDDDFTLINASDYLINFSSDYNTINEIISDLKTVNLDKLSDYKDQADLRNEEDYTGATWSALEGALDLPEETNAEIVAKTEAINTAIEGLKFAGQDDLDAAKLAASGLDEDDYTAETWSALEGALEFPEETNAEIVAKTEAINTAIEGLKFAGQDDLDAAKLAASGLVEEDYTAETWSALEDALELPEATNAEIVAKTAAINTAIEGLIENNLTFDLSIGGWNLISTDYFVNHSLTKNNWIQNTPEKVLTYINGEWIGGSTGADINLAVDQLTPVSALYVKVEETKPVKFGIVYEYNNEVPFSLATQKLKFGWNLISVPENDIAGGTLLNGLINGGLTNLFIPDQGYVDTGNIPITPLYALKGYWVHMNNDYTFSLIVQKPEAEDVT